MDNLWKKEVENTPDPVYVDLFANSCNKKEFREWNEQLKDNFWKHQFRSVTVGPNKSNKSSTEFRIMGNSVFGNDNFPLQSRLKVSIELYTESLMFAEPNTINVSLAFANRSACFFHRKMYEQCLTDMEYARKANYPENLMPKLEKRRAQCMELMRTHAEAKRSYEQPKLDFPADENYPCMANVVQIIRNDKFGRLIEAKCDIDVGKTVLVEEAFCSLGSKDEVSCFTCLKRNKCFIPCPQCTDVVFCSNDCMTRNGIHKMSCGALYHRMPLNIRVHVQSVLVAIDTIPNAEDLMDFVERSLELDTPPNLLDSRRKYAFYLKLNAVPNRIDGLRAYQVYTSLMAIPAIEAIFDSERKRRFLMHLAVHHIVIQKSNNFSGTTFGFDVASVACALSLINHSCAPNIFNFAVDNQEVCVTIRPIKKGEQLFISYAGQQDDTTTAQRQATLKEKFGFECECDKCRPCLPADKRVQMTTDPIFRQLQHKDDAADIADEEKRAQRQRICSEFLNKYGNLPWSEEIDRVTSELQQIILDS